MGIASAATDGQLAPCRRLVGRLRRSPSGASTGLAERRGKQESGVRSRAWSRRRFAQNPRQGSESSLFPASIARVIRDFGSFGCRPAVSVVTEGLLARLGIGVGRGGKERAFWCRRNGFRSSDIANSQQGRGGSVAERICAQSTLKVFVEVGRVGLFGGTCCTRVCASRRRGKIDSAGRLRLASGSCVVCVLLDLTVRAGWSGIERDPARNGSSDGHVEVRRVSGVRGGMPTVLIVCASHERCVGAVRTGEGSQASESGLQARRTQKGGVFLSARPERALRESDQCTRVACVQLGNTRQEPDWPVSRVHEERGRQVSSVSWMLEEVFSSRITSGSEERRCAFSEQIRLLQFALVLWWYVRQPRDVVSVSNGRWSAIGGVAGEESADGER
eukprot:3871582-Pleurochrysis_carterae.AAC.3